jgi:hypothetical protein
VGEGDLHPLHPAQGRGVPAGARRIVPEPQGRAAHREGAWPGAEREEVRRGGARVLDSGPGGPASEQGQGEDPRRDAQAPDRQHRGPGHGRRTMRIASRLEPAISHPV